MSGHENGADQAPRTLSARATDDETTRQSAARRRKRESMSDPDVIVLQFDVSTRAPVGPHFEDRLAERPNAAATSQHNAYQRQGGFRRSSRIRTYTERPMNI